MNCRKIKELISVYLDGELGGQEQRLLKSHLATCRQCREEVEAIEKAWNMLGEVEKIDPDPNYIARFWTRVETQMPWYKKILPNIRENMFRRRLVPALAMACVLILVGVVTIRHISYFPEADSMVAKLSEVDLDLVESFDIIENFEIIQEIDFLSDFEIIESVDQFDAS